MKTIDISHQELAEAFERQGEELAKLGTKNSLLQKENSHWRQEAEKYERWYREELQNKK